MNKIDKNKKYKTVNGYPVTIYATDVNNSRYTVHACVHGVEDRLVSFTSTGRFNITDPNDYKNDYDLVEVTPWGGIKVDDRVLVRKLKGLSSTWFKRYFAGVNEKGEATCFDLGKTSWTNEGLPLIQWDECIPYIEGEDYGV